MDGKVCKIFIMEKAEQRVLKPHLHENLIQKVIKKKSAIKKCLFGVADPEDTSRMLEEQYQMDKDRILHSFGINIQDIEEMENLGNNDLENNKNEHNKILAKGTERRILKAKRKSLGKMSIDSSQPHITDFYQARKAVSNPAKRRHLDSENRENITSAELFN